LRLGRSEDKITYYSVKSSYELSAISCWVWSEHFFSDPKIFFFIVEKSFAEKSCWKSSEAIVEINLSLSNWWEIYDSWFNWRRAK